ncbi:MAG: DMT family transporter [Ahrensia sp.]
MELWIPITIGAAFVQNIRSSLQKHLRGTMGTAGATFVRFGFGVPFALLFLGLSLHATASSLPSLNVNFVGWIVLAALSQIIAQVLLIILFTRRNFAVGSAYVRTEPVLAAAFGVALLAETPSLAVMAAIAVSLAGVLLISLAENKMSPRAVIGGLFSNAAALGLGSAAIFGLAAVSFRAASLSLGGPNFLVQGGVTLCVAIIVQSIILAVWILLRDPAEFGRIRGQWKTSATVGFVGALASFGWFTAMTLEQAALVKAVAQVEMLFAIATTWLVFKERFSRRELLGCALIVSGVLLLIALA